MFGYAQAENTHITFPTDKHRRNQRTASLSSTWLILGTMGIELKAMVGLSEPIDLHKIDTALKRRLLATLSIKNIGIKLTTEANRAVIGRL